MNFYGFQGVCFKWFQNYLHNRQQYVACNGQKSSLEEVRTGIPQGSALGPLLFILFINDFPLSLKSSISNMFADDCCIYVFGKDINQTKVEFQNSVNEASHWYNNNNLPVNIPKSVAMMSAPEHILSRLNDDQKVLNTLLNGETLCQVDNAPYLGIHLDCSLKWNDYIQKLCKKVSSKLALLSRLRKFIDKETLLLLYNAIIQPNIDYAISVWGYSPVYSKNMISRLQHRAARIISGNFDFVNFRGEDLTKRLGIQRIDTRRDYFTAVLMYKIKHELAPKRLIDFFIDSKDTHDIPTRSGANDKFQIPKPNYEFYRKSFKYQGSRLWNSLDAKLRSANDIEEFKRMYKKVYFK